MSKTVLESVLTCPHCGVTKQETMPTDACQFFYECSDCKVLLRPKPERLLRVLLVRLSTMPTDPTAA